MRYIIIPYKKKIKTLAYKNLLIIHITLRNIKSQVHLVVLYYGAPGTPRVTFDAAAAAACTGSCEVVPVMMDDGGWRDHVVTICRADHHAQPPRSQLQHRPR